MTRKKGRNPRNARPGNKNTARGPRVGRPGKVTKPLPQPRKGAATLSRPKAKADKPKREKTPDSGRDFKKGQNSHTGEVFQRGADMLPRGNMTLYFRVLYNDERETLYQRHCRILRHGTDRNVLALSQIMADRIAGKPGRADQASAPAPATFVIMTRDGQEQPLLPPKAAASSPGSPAAPAPMPADDALILQYTAPVRPV